MMLFDHITVGELGLTPDGWHLIEFKKAPGWVSGRYGRLVK